MPRATRASAPVSTVLCVTELCPELGIGIFAKTLRSNPYLLNVASAREDCRANTPTAVDRREKFQQPGQQLLQLLR